MSEECWVTVVRAWSHASERSNVMIRMINRHGAQTRDRHFVSIDEAVEELRRWLSRFEQSVGPGCGDRGSQQRDDDGETDG